MAANTPIVPLDYSALDFVNHDKGADFWDMFIPFDGAPLIEASERDYLVEARVPLTVHEVKLGTTQEYGATWFITVEYPEDHGDGNAIRAIAMSPNDIRNRQFTAMSTYLSFPPEERQPLIAQLEAFTAGNGLRAYRFSKYVPF